MCAATLLAAQFCSTLLVCMEFACAFSHTDTRAHPTIPLPAESGGGGGGELQPQQQPWRAALYSFSHKRIAMYEMLCAWNGIQCTHATGWCLRLHTSSLWFSIYFVCVCVCVWLHNKRMWYGGKGRSIGSLCLVFGTSIKMHCTHFAMWTNERTNKQRWTDVDKKVLFFSFRAMHGCLGWADPIATLRFCSTAFCQIGHILQSSFALLSHFFFTCCSFHSFARCMNRFLCYCSA